MKKTKTPKIFIATPSSPFGGMYKVAEYLIQNQLLEQVPPSQKAELVLLDTRDKKGALLSIFVLLSALMKLLSSRITEEVAGVHINIAERMSLFRKSILLLFAKVIGVPVILHLHAAQFHQFYQGLPRFLKTYTRWIFSKADLVAVLGQNANDFVTDILQVDNKKVITLINGVPKAIFKRTPYSDKNTQKRVFFLGYLTERKGISDLLNALAISREFKNNQVQAVIAGPGDIDLYQNKAKDLGISKHVQFTGMVDQQQAAKWMSTADIFILPSYDEGLPLSILEALSNGVAVICTPVGEIEDNLTDGKNAIFVQPGDIEAIANQIDNLVCNNDLRNELATNGKNLFEQNYSIGIFADKVAEIHLNIFEKSSRPTVNKTPQ